MQKITPFLWFDGQAEEAAKFYTSIFKNSKIGKIARYTESGSKGSGQKIGSVMTVEFEIEGQKFIGLNGGPIFKFTEATSFAVYCRTQAEIDYYWKKLTAGGGKEVHCGWLKDKFGLSWQIVPAQIDKWMSGKDSAKSERVMAALLQMVKPDIKALEAAYDGKSNAAKTKRKPAP